MYYSAVKSSRTENFHQSQRELCQSIQEEQACSKHTPKNVVLNTETLWKPFYWFCCSEPIKHRSKNYSLSLNWITYFLEDITEKIGRRLTFPYKNVSMFYIHENSLFSFEGKIIQTPIAPSGH